MQLISVTDAAKILGLGRSTTYRLAQEGDLPVVRISKNTIRIHKERLIAMIESSLPAATLPPAGGVEETPCPTEGKARRTGGSATKRQMERTLDDLLAPTTTTSQRP